MKKWFFSDSGKVHGPLDLQEAKEYLADKPNVYGWHPSFNQWKPVNCISEFAGIIPATEQTSLVPKELTDKFLAKKKRLQTKLTSIGDSINHTQSTLGKFERQIESYKDLTKNLNDDVKSAIVNIEKKHASLTKKLSQVKNAVEIAEVEIDDAINTFNQRVNSNDVVMPSCDGSSAPASTPSKVTKIDTAQVSKAKIAETKLATPHKRVELAEVDKAPAKTEPKAKPVAKKQEKSNPAEAEQANKTATESFNGMKNMMKSVFRGDKKVEADKPAETQANPDKPLSMAERLRLAQNNP